MSESKLPPLLDDDLPFDQIMDAIRRGDEVAQREALERIMPRVVAAIQQRFGSRRACDPEDAVASAFRTIQRRGWNFARKNDGKPEAIEPSDWAELAGLCVRYAYNKARTHRKRRELPSLPGRTGEEEMTWEPTVEQAGVSEDAVRREMPSLVQGVVAQLSERLDPQDRVILRCKYDGLRYQDVKDELKLLDVYLTEDGIRRRWERKIVPQLRRLLGEFEGD